MHEAKVSDEWTRQLAEDIDSEIAEMTREYEKKLEAEREATLRFKGENGSFPPPHHRGCISIRNVFLFFFPGCALVVCFAP